MIIHKITVKVADKHYDFLFDDLPNGVRIMDAVEDTYYAGTTRTKMLEEVRKGNYFYTRHNVFSAKGKHVGAR